MPDPSGGTRNHKAEAQANYKAEVKGAKARDRGWYQQTWVRVGGVVVLIVAVWAVVALG